MPERLVPKETESNKVLTLSDVLAQLGPGSRLATLHKHFNITLAMPHLILTCKMCPIADPKNRWKLHAGTVLEEQDLAKANFASLMSHALAPHRG